MSTFSDSLGVICLRITSNILSHWNANRGTDGFICSVVLEVDHVALGNDITVRLSESVVCKI
jgi:hypothetical protein